MTTTNLAEFGKRELAEAGDLLTAYANNKMTKLAREYFYEEGVQLMFNKYSGNVFLTNEDFQVLMFNGKNLDLFLNSPYEGYEGFVEDLLVDFSDMNQEDQEWLIEYLTDDQKSEAKEMLADEEELIEELGLEDY